MAFTYSERRRVTASGGINSYPVLLDVTDARWKSVANGGLAFVLLAGYVSS